MKLLHRQFGVLGQMFRFVLMFEDNQYIQA